MYVGRDGIRHAKLVGVALQLLVSMIPDVLGTLLGLNGLNNFSCVSTRVMTVEVGDHWGCPLVPNLGSIIQ